MMAVGRPEKQRVSPCSLTVYLRVFRCCYAVGRFYVYICIYMYMRPCLAGVSVTALRCMRGDISQIDANTRTQKSCCGEHRRHVHVHFHYAELCGHFQLRLTNLDSRGNGGSDGGNWGWLWWCCWCRTCVCVVCVAHQFGVFREPHLSVW